MRYAPGTETIDHFPEQLLSNDRYGLRKETLGFEIELNNDHAISGGTPLKAPLPILRKPKGSINSCP